MTAQNVNGLKIDEKAQKILRLLEGTNGHVANTSDVREQTTLESHGVISYRYDKLEQAGLIERWVADVEGEDYDTITYIELTEFGREYDAPDADKTLTERVERIEEQRDKLWERVLGQRDDLKVYRERIEELEERVEELEGDCE